MGLYNKCYMEIHLICYTESQQSQILMKGTGVVAEMLQGACTPQIINIFILAECKDIDKKHLFLSSLSG